MAPKALAPVNTGSRPERPVRASGKARAAKAMECTSLSLPSGAGGGASSGQSIATVKTAVTTKVEGDVEIFAHTQRLSARHAGRKLTS
jgi:hypothetical protein